MHRFIVYVDDRGAPFEPTWVGRCCYFGSSYSAKVSITLICALCHSAKLSAVVLKTESAPNRPLIRPPHALNEASVAPVMVRTSRVASCHGAPFSRVLTSSHLSIPKRRPPRSDTAIGGQLLRPPERLNITIWRYMLCVYRLTGSTAPDILIYFPGSLYS